MKCKKGGLIIRRHNDVCGELQRLSEMNWPGTVLEPIIREGNPSLPAGFPGRDGLVGDLFVRGGVHTPQTDVMPDIQVIYLNAPSRLRRGRKKKGRPKRTDDLDASCEDFEEAKDGEKERGPVVWIKLKVHPKVHLHLHLLKGPKRRRETRGGLGREEKR